MEQYNELLSNIGQVIFKERKSQKLTRAALAEKAGLSIQTINKVEHGQNTTTMYLWVKYTTASRVYIHLVAKAVRIESAMG